MERKKYTYIAWPILLIVYAVGRVGLSMPPYAGLFAGLTWVNLLLSFVIVFLFHNSWNIRFAAACIGIGAAGWLLEVAGVHTAVIFGEYRYGSVLGAGAFGVPFILAINWLLLVYCATNLTARFALSRLAQAILAGVVLTLLDVLLEPFAIRFGLWQWAGDVAPLRNYLAWFVFSTVFSWVMLYFSDGIKNNTALFWLLLQALFFGSFYIT